MDQAALLPGPGGAPRHDVPRGGRSGFAIIEGRQVHYLEWGHGGRPPVLVLRGSQSDVLSDEGAQAITALIPNARLEIVERAGHLAAGDNPLSTVERISRFLRELG